MDIGNDRYLRRLNGQAAQLLNAVEAEELEALFVDEAIVAQQKLDGDRILEVRGTGAIWGVQLAEGLSAIDVREELLLTGVIARPIGTSVVAFCPPLVIDDAGICRCAHSLAAAVSAV